MIPEANITAWSLTAPWAEPRQVEQDLIVSRARRNLQPRPAGSRAEIQRRYGPQ